MTEIQTFKDNLNRLLSSQKFEDIFLLPTFKHTSFSKLFTFPKTADYHYWIRQRKLHRDYKFIVGKSTKALYNQIIEHEDIPIAQNVKSLKVNGVYAIADFAGKILYIGKSGANFKEDCNDLVINRVLDHLVPESINKKMQNTPQLWARIKKGEKIQVYYCSGLNRLVPSLLELYLLNQYYLKWKTLPPLNKRRSKQK